MKQHNLRAIDVCEELKLNKSYFSKMKNGSMLPPNFAFVEEMARVMRLSPFEKDALCKAYQYSKFGASYRVIEDSVREIYDVNPLNKTSKNRNSIAPKSFHNGELINGRDNVLQAVHQIIIGSEAEMNMIFIPENEELCSIIKDSMAEKDKDFVCQWMMYLNDVQGLSADNIKSFSQIVQIMMAECEIDINYGYANMNNFYEYSVFPYIFVSEKEAILINRSCANAIYLNNEKITEFYRKQFHTKFESAEKLCMMFDDLEDFLNEHDTIFKPYETGCPHDLYIVEHNMCIINEVNSESVYSHLALDEKKERLMQSYMKFLYQYCANVKTQYLMFSKDGAKELLEADEYYEFNKFMTFPLSKTLRRNYYKSFVDKVGKTDLIQPNIIQDSFIGSNTHLSNIWSDGKVLFLFNFKDSYRILIMREKSIANSLIGYLDSLRECGIILSKKDSIRFMHEAWEKYGE